MVTIPFYPDFFMRENFLEIVNQLLSYVWLVAIAGILVAAWTERKLLLEIFHKKTATKPWYKSIQPFAKRLIYVVVGFLLVMLSFTLVNQLLDVLVTKLAPKDLPPMQNPELASAFFKWLLQDKTYLGMYAVAMIIFAGYALMLSAGRKWLKNTAGIMLIATFLLVLIMVIATLSVNGTVM